MAGIDSEPTLGEVARAVALLRDDMRGGFDAIGVRLDKFVLAEVYAADRRGFEERLVETNRHIEDIRQTHRADAKAAEEVRLRDLKEASEARQRDESRQASQRRWLIGSVTVPICIVLIQFLMNNWHAAR